MPLLQRRLLLVPLALVFFACVLAAEPAPVRYDGKTFEEWREKLRTELKPESRAECINAIITFGQNNRATESAEIIFNLVGKYDPDDEDAKPIWKAAERIGKLGRPIIPLLLVALRSEKPGVRYLAQQVLYFHPRCLSEGLEAEMPQLLQAAHSEDAECVSVLLDVICGVAMEKPDTAGLVLELLGSPNSKVRSVALAMVKHEVSRGIIRGVEIEANKAIPILISIVNQQDNSDRWLAISCLQQYGADAHKAVPALCKLLNQSREDTWEDEMIYRLLGKIGPSAKEALPILKQKWARYAGTNGTNSTVIALRQALQDIDTNEAAPILKPEKDSTSPQK